jgi:hypothetical protein
VPPNKGLQLTPASLGVPVSGSLLASKLIGFGEAGQRWLAQLKPDPLAGLSETKQHECRRMGVPSVRP